MHLRLPFLNTYVYSSTECLYHQTATLLYYITIFDANKVALFWFNLVLYWVWVTDDAGNVKELKTWYICNFCTYYMYHCCWFAFVLRMVNDSQLSSACPLYAQKRIPHAHVLYHQMLWQQCCRVFFIKLVLYWIF